MSEVSIIIVNYKSDLLTIQYVKNELSKLRTQFKVIVVNNASTRESNEHLCQALNLTLIESFEQGVDDSCAGVVISSIDNLGFAKGNNLGAKFALHVYNTPFLLFTNNDIVIMDSSVVDILISRMKLYSDIGLIGPDCRDVYGVSQSPRPYLPFYHKYIFSYWLTFLVSKERKVRILQLDYPQKAKEGDHYKLSGSFLMARSSDFFSCGMMDSNTFLYCEEEILTERMYRLGRRVYFCPSSMVIHEQSQTVGRFINNRKKMSLDFTSNSYYYRTYRNVSTFSIMLGKMNHYLFFYLKALLKR